MGNGRRLPITGCQSAIGHYRFPIRHRPLPITRFAIDSLAITRLAIGHRPLPITRLAIGHCQLAINPCRLAIADVDWRLAMCLPLPIADWLLQITELAMQSE
jgi:hypothetical protein